MITTIEPPGAPIHSPLASRLSPSVPLVALAAPDSFSHPLVIQSLAAHAARGEHLGVIVGHNRFNLYSLSRQLQEHGLDPRPLLAHIELSRAFTCHQLHRRILTIQPGRADRWAAFFVLGLLDTFYDEDVKQHEAQRLLRESLVLLQTLADSGLPILITVSAPSEPGRERFLEIVARQVDVYWEPAPGASQLAAPQQLALALPNE